MHVLLTSLVMLSLLFGILSCHEDQHSEPNVIFILADDFGYMDMQAYAQHTTGVDRKDMFYETPNLDKLVSEGIAFTRAYANQLCSPTRASILTGKHAGRLGFTTATPLRDTYYNQNKKWSDEQYPHDVIYHSDAIDIEQAWRNGSSNTALPSGTEVDDGWDEVTIAEALSGYHSAFIGKWHIGGHGAEGYQPGDQGFHPIAWFDAGGSPYFNWRKTWDQRSKDRFPDIPQKVWRIGNSGSKSDETYLTDDLTQQALSFLDKRAGVKDQPFFLYFCHFAVHSPWHAKREDSIYFSNKATLGWNGHRDPRYAGMVRGLDQSVGDIMSKLKQTGLDDNTLVIFMSDNGGWDGRHSMNGMATNNAPLRGGKACLTEGGVRVPLIFYWKGRLQGGQWRDMPVDCTDLFPTILDMIGSDPSSYYQDIDGRSLKSLLVKSSEDVAEYTDHTRYWHYPFNVSVYSPFDGNFLTPRSAIMEGNFKLIFDWHGHLRLFDVAADLTESNNLAGEQPDRTLRMFSNLIVWLEENVAPQYWPVINPDYDAAKEVRKDSPFVDLYRAHKSGEDVLALANLQ